MTRLTATIKAAAMIGFPGFVADSAIAQTSAFCPSHEEVIYFAPGSAELNSEQKLAIASTAEVARACGAPGILIHANGNVERARAVATAFSQLGMTATIVAQLALALSRGTMTARSITLPSQAKLAQAANPPSFQISKLSCRVSHATVSARAGSQADRHGQENFGPHL